MVDPNQPRPFAVVGQTAGRRQIAELLQCLGLDLKLMPQAGQQRVDCLRMPIDLLPDAQGLWVILLAGRT